MAEIRQDLLGLQYSQDFEIQGMQEANVDLQLPPAAITLATVYGTVSDGSAPSRMPRSSSLTARGCPTSTP